MDSSCKPSASFCSGLSSSACCFLDGDGEKELIELYWDETSRSMQIKVIKPQTKVKEVQLPVMPQVFTSDEQAILYTVEDVTDLGNLILIDLDSNDGRVNLLVSATLADGTERTYELHVENGELICGHTVEGYCFLNDSEQQELMLGAPTDLLGAKYGYREVSFLFCWCLKRLLSSLIFFIRPPSIWMLTRCIRRVRFPGQRIFTLPQPQF